VPPDTACREARFLALTGQPEQAWELLHGLLRDDPDCLPALLLAGELLERSRQPERALAHFEQACHVAPDSAAAWNARASGLRGLGRAAEALAAAERAHGLLALEPNRGESASAHLTLLLCLRDLRRYREALAVAEEGLARTPDAVLAEWADTLQQEWEQAERERC
jgi:tetratricopeptide (TPR) repeat protein